MRYRVKGQEMSDFIKNVDNLMTTKFAYKVMEMKPLARETEWTGPAKETFTRKYEEVVKELDKIPYIISLYTEFLEKTLDNFDDAVEEFKKRFVELNQELDKKGQKDELSSII